MNLKLATLQKQYDEVRDELNNIKANGSLSKLINLRTAFDESFDSFFDRKELRIKYGAWDIENDCPDFNFTNSMLIKKLSSSDLYELILFYDCLISNILDEIAESTPAKED